MKDTNYHFSRRAFLGSSIALTSLALSPFFGTTLSRQSFAAQGTIERVTFADPAGTLSLVGYLADPLGSSKRPAVILLPSQGGPYKKGAAMAGAAGLKPRYRLWMQHWYDQGYAVLLLDSFTPAGYANGYGNKPPKGLNPLTDRAHDAYGALSYLRRRRNISMERVFLMGWGPGGTAALSAINSLTAKDMEVFLGINLEFRAATALFPGCNALLNLSGLGKYKPSGKIFFVVAGKDQSSDPVGCKSFANRLPNKYLGGNLYYPESGGGFDDGVPMMPQDKKAFQEVMTNVTEFFRSA